MPIQTAKAKASDIGMTDAVDLDALPCQAHRPRNGPRKSDQKDHNRRLAQRYADLPSDMLLRNRQDICSKAPTQIRSSSLGRFL
ncbi:hypothetical protein [Paracoccus xiamenensis]|uniref:hypothetical protein n=1 Tax=Paracoccus xiamenensis TaxID=2714901 RepID=UPI0014090582|nr:hypothetical protein [Paracoccus xiamenensis]NHF73753.1 hypothetical protein [Paracoccus xiamenensis]